MTAFLGGNYITQVQAIVSLQTFIFIMFENRVKFLEVCTIIVLWYIFSVMANISFKQVRVCLLYYH